MIDDRTKKELLAELAKSGNVYYACAKTNVSRATYYRWRAEDTQFRRASDRALRHGRGNMVDIAEQALMQKVKEKDLGAIKYMLSHNSRTYGPSRKPQEVVLRHVREGTPPVVSGKDAADYFFDRLESEYDKEQHEKREREALTPEQEAAIGLAIKNAGLLPEDPPSNKDGT